MNRQTLILVILAASALASNPVGATVIYSNRVGAQLSGYAVIIDNNETDSGVELPLPPPPQSEDVSRVGDSITFAGTDRFVTAFATRYLRAGGFPITADIELGIFQNNAGLPGGLIWSGTRPAVSISSSIPPVEVVFNPNVLVPDSICFAIAFHNVVGTAQSVLGVGLTSGNAPGAVGSSPNTLLYQDSSSLAWRAEDFTSGTGGDNFRHVEAVITAIPAPGALATLLAAVPLAAARRTRSPRPR